MEGKVNPFASLLQSRKFWLAVLDFVAAVLGLWVGALVPEQTAILIMATWGALQPVLITVVAMIAYEDKARLETKARQFEAAAYAAERARQFTSSEAPHDITTLIGMVFAKRDFRSLPIDAAIAYFKDTFGVTDLTESQEVAFRAAYVNPELRAAVDEVWRIYYEKRANGELPITASPWWS